MATSEAQKRASTKWTLENTKSVCCKIRNEDYELFKKYAEAHGTTVTTMVKRYIMECIDKDK